METITVAPENDHLYSFDGILYDAYGHLLCCPAGKNGKLVLPNTCHGIDKCALSGCQKITSIILPEKDFYYLDHGCMRDCTSLEELIIPKSILRIEERAFFNSSKLKRIVVLTGKNVFCNEFDLSPFENCHKKLVIVGLRGSEVEAYAQEHNIKFTPIDEY